MLISYMYAITYFQLNQMTSAFPFGVAIKAVNFNVNEKYQNFVESNSEVVTLANKLKWRLMEWNKVGV